MKIAIAGAGLTGAYLYRRLCNERHEIDIFDSGPGTSCGLTPCAWGTSRGFPELIRDCGLHPEKYMLRHLDHLIMNDLRIKADLMTFDKPNLIRDLLEGTEVKRPPFDMRGYDRVFDATGGSRSLLPPIAEDILLPCVQFRVKGEPGLGNRIKLGGIGYAWSFPLSENDYHIGCGSLLSDPRRVLEGLGWIRNGPAMKIICACHGAIRLTGPQRSHPFVKERIWGVGEAIGCVAPLAGDGVVPGMRSVQILMDRWDDPGRYTETIIREFDWMTGERRVVDKLRRNEPLGTRDAWVLQQNSKRMGMEVRLTDAAFLLKTLR